MEEKKMNNEEVWIIPLTIGIYLVLCFGIAIIQKI